MEKLALNKITGTNVAGGDSGNCEKEKDDRKQMDEDQKMEYYVARQRILMRHIYARAIEFAQYSDSDSDSEDDDQGYCTMTFNICQCCCCNTETQDSEKTINIIHNSQ